MGVGTLVLEQGVWRFQKLSSWDILSRSVINVANLLTEAIEGEKKWHRCRAPVTLVK